MAKNECSFELYAIKQNDKLEPLKTIVPKDGTRALVVGEDWEIRKLHELLTVYLETGRLAGEIPDYHEQLGTRWLTCGEAEAMSGVQARTIRYAAKNGFIRGAEKNGRDWHFPQRTFLHWIRNRPKPGRK